MTARFQRLQALFDEGVALPAAERAAWCAVRCADDAALRTELLRLLETDEDLAQASTASPLRHADRAIDDAADRAAPPPTRVGRFVLIEEIGRGGMGRVFRARNESTGFDQEVAIKLVRRELATGEVLRRFVKESRSLAALNHPGIARMLDAGESDDGTPYIAMELVDGQTLLDHCRTRSLSIGSRLALFRQVLEAVAHAHRNLIVHRDIKPGNVMVDAEGRVKLLDFGIAKPLDAPAGETATADRYFTPAYAAPEQFANRETGVGCDVYALGALLYELLAGAPPFQLDGVSAAQAERLILSTPPAPLHRTDSAADAERRRRLGVEALGPWRKRLRGDLDSIVQKALRKEPERRYLSVEQLDDDVARYLEGRPVAAAGGNSMYRARKFVGRHRVSVAALLVVVAAIGTAFGVAVRSATIANLERDRAQAALGIMREAFKGADPTRLAGPELSARQILQAASERVAPLATTQPLLFAELAAEIADVQLELGIVQREDPLIGRAVELLPTTNLTDATRWRVRLVEARRRVALQDYVEAEAALAALEAERPQDAELLALWARHWIIRQESERAMDYSARAVRAAERGTDEAQRIEAYWRRAEAQNLAGQPDEALASFDRLLAGFPANIDAQPAGVLLMRLNRTRVLTQLGRHDEAIAESAAVAAALPSRFGVNSSMVAQAKSAHATAVYASGAVDTAIPLYEAATEIYARSLGQNHSSTIKNRFNVALMLYKAGFDPARADRQFEAAIAGAAALRGAAHPLVWYFRGGYAEALLARGERERARAVLLPNGVEPDLGEMLEPNRDIYLGFIDRAYGPIRCPDTAPADAKDDPAAAEPAGAPERARRLYCAAPRSATGG